MSKYDLELADLGAHDISNQYAEHLCAVISNWPIDFEYTEWTQNIEPIFFKHVAKQRNIGQISKNKLVNSPDNILINDTTTMPVAGLVNK